MGRQETVAALGELGDPAAIPALAERLVERRIRHRARRGRRGARPASRLHPGSGGARFAPACERPWRKETEPAVQAAVREALERVRAALSVDAQIQRR